MLWVMILSSFAAQGQTNSPSSLSDIFRTYHVEKVKSHSLKSDSEEIDLVIHLDKNSKVVARLTESYLISPNYHLSTTNKVTTISDKDIATPYEGFVIGAKNSFVRLSLKDGFMYGYVSIGKDKYYIEPGRRYDKSLSRNDHVVYKAEDVKVVKKMKCASDFEEEHTGKLSGHLKSSGGCQLIDLAVALDWSYVQDHGGIEEAVDQSMSIMNMVAGSFEGSFSDDLRFEIVEHFVSDCSTCDPWTASTNAHVLLDAFTAWGPTGFSATHDVGQLWTNRNLCDNSGSCDVAGLAWVGALCTGQRYLILEDFTTTAWQLRVLVAHEMGHILGASHDVSGSPHIMAPSIASNTESWSTTSISVINNKLTQYTCTADCLIGSCSEITSVATVGCQPGTPGTYSLVIDIRHGGGGTSTGFDVIVDGVSYPQSWEESPQTVTIQGLPADGANEKTVAISASDGSDSGCQGSAIFDAPPGDCSLVVEEDFNNCTLPSGWTESSTNIYTWNGGDPLVQYRWKFDDATRQFANYDDQSNASSLKTIDGTCMALMDDDIINHTLYTGVVTLTSATYDMGGMDTVKLKFDYNFHPFEDGGKGDNDSYFEVNVYDGAEWVTVLHDTDSECDWHNVWPSSCTDEADIDVSAYANDAFAVRFVYSDGNNSQWAGMVALDNIEVRGSIAPAGPTCNDGQQNGGELGVDCGGPCPPCPDGLTGPCEDVIVLENDADLDLYEARTLVMTNGPVSVQENTVFAADNTHIEVGFEVPKGNVLTVNSDGCE